MTDIEVPVTHTGHDGGEFSPVTVSVAVSWPAPTFVENLAIDSAGAIFVSLYSHNLVDRYDPATGMAAPFADLPAPPVGSPSMRVARSRLPEGPFGRALAIHGKSAPMVRSSTGPICPTRSS